LPAIDRDIDALAEKLDGTRAGEPAASVVRIVSEVLGRTEREELTYGHVPATRFVPGKSLEIDLTVGVPVAAVNPYFRRINAADRSKVAAPAVSANLYYRHVNQAERFNVAAMDRAVDHYHATIPGTYTDSAYPLQYYFEVKTTTGSTLMFPGFSKGLTDQPYFVVRRA
jgi:hypothetical protein